MKKNNKLFVAILSFLPLIGYAMPVHPRQAQDLQSYEFGDLVRMYMLDENSVYSTINWDFNADNPNFIWLTDGIETDKDSGYIKRSGLVRINLLGVVPQVLKKGKEEVAWDIDYKTPYDERDGVTSILLSQHDNACFGVLGDNCRIQPFSSLKNSSIAYQKVCQDRENIIDTGNAIYGYKLSAKKKKPIYLAYINSSGSGGSSSFYELRFKEDKLCE